MTIPSEQRYLGCLLGLALGDALGAPYEGGPLERLLWRAIGRTRTGLRRWTDDTQMSLDLAESLLARGVVDPDDLAARFAASYRWSRGYGPGTARLLRAVRAGRHWSTVNRATHPQGSFGNGAAMRAPVLGLAWLADREALTAAVRVASIVTHAHPLAVEGAQVVAVAVAELLRGVPPDLAWQGALKHAVSPAWQGRPADALGWLRGGEQPGCRVVARVLGRGMAATESVISAVYLAARFIDQPFLAMLDFARGMRGDVDTLSAISGALWGTARGGEALPEVALRLLEQRERIAAVADALHRRFATEPA